MKRLGILAMMLLLGISSACADKSGEADVEATLKKMFPGAKPDRIHDSVLPGFYEVVIGTEVLYLSKDGKYMLQGDLIDVQGRRNLTEDMRSKERLALINGIDPSTMIIFAPQQVKHTVTVFTDTDCPYCRKMHKEIEEYNKRGIAIRYVSFPLSGAGGPNYYKAISVWCSADRNAALTKAKSGAAMETKRCNNHPVDAHMAVAARIGVNSTPTLIFEDGGMASGYIPPDQMSAMLDGAK